MLHPFGTGLNSDSIVHRYGFDGNEPKQTERIHKLFAPLGARSAFAVNTWYPEIEGGYYINRALLVLIDEAIRSAGFFRVILEVWRQDGLVPIEGDGQFLLPEQYALVNEQQEQIGVLQTWQFQAGGGGDYYGDNLIIDIILPKRVIQQIVDGVDARCEAMSVRFGRVPPVANK